MTDLILILGLLGTFGFGYFLMDRYDRFLEKIRRSIADEGDFR